MRIVLDTNVLVSGLLSPYDIPAEIVRLVSTAKIQLCFDARIISEYEDVLKRPKFKIDEERVAALLDQIEVHGVTVATEPLQNRLPDTDDEPFLEVAIAAEVSYLVTGNTKHFPKRKYQGVKIVTPNRFVEEYRKEKLKG